MSRSTDIQILLEQRKILKTKLEILSSMLSHGGKLLHETDLISSTSGQEMEKELDIANEKYKKASKTLEEVEDEILDM